MVITGPFFVFSVQLGSTLSPTGGQWSADVLTWCCPGGGLGMRRVYQFPAPGSADNAVMALTGVRRLGTFVLKEAALDLRRSTKLSRYADTDR
jgi:hypothetical protein